MQIAEDNKSVLVSSGTGSGKTECFMVPVLEDLIRQHALKKGPMSGVQAIFLYPLNALINSQQERLRSWTKGFNGDIRFALYNGETRQNSFDVKEEQNLHPEQILSRENLRDTPPSVLVTNATMLEYMLVRKADEPIISKSKGMLKYIVLDEAHSYIGSQAAELSLLLRRVMEAYGVGPGTDNPVQLIATSATIGEDTPEGNAQLESFISALAGTTADRVEVIRGYRDVPALSVQTKINDRSPREQLSFLQSLSSEALYEELSHFRLTRALRQAFNNSAKAAISLSELVNIAQQYDPNVDSESLLDILDLMTFAQPNEPNIDAFVPLRIHSFLRTIAGLWACANPDCSQQHPKLQQPTWPFGQVYFDVQHACSCGSPVFELLNCSGCGTPYLAAEEKIEEGQSWLKSRRLDLDDDEFLLDAEGGADTDDIAVNSGSFDRLLGLGGDLTTVSAEATTTGLIVQSDGVTFSVPMLRPEQKKEVGGGVKRSFRVSGHFKEWLTPRYKSERSGFSENFSLHTRGVSSATRLAGCSLIRSSTSVR